MPAPSRSTAPTGPRLGRLRLQNVRCFEAVDIPFDPRLTVIIGGNGTGKTTIAEAIASLVSGEREGLAEFPLRRGTTHGAIEVFGTDEPAAIGAWTVDGDGSSRDALPEDHLLFAYGRYRRVPRPEERRRPGMPELLGPEWNEARYETRLERDLSGAIFRNRTTTLNEPDNGLLQDLRGYVRTLHELRKADPQMELAWNELNESVRELGHGLEHITLDARGKTSTPAIVRNGVPLDLRELSDGYQAILVIVFDLIFRYAFMPPVPERPLARAATVVIDEVDLHLHPSWQRSVVRQLTRLFPGTQFILTTHSPAVVQGAIDDGHGVLVLREGEGGVRVDPLDEEDREALEGAQIGSLLVDERLFGVRSLYSPKYGVIEQKVRRIRRKIEAGEASGEERRELVEGLDRLQKLMAKDQKRRAEAAIFSEIAKVQIAYLKSLGEEQAEHEERGDGEA